MSAFGSALSAVGDKPDIEIANPPSDGISDIAWSPAADFIAASSWDNQVRIWEFQPTGQTVPKASYSHQAPALCCSWSRDGTKVFSGGADKAAMMFDLTSGQSQQVGAHDAPIKCIRWYEDGNNRILVTGSWDKTVKYWDTRTPTPVGSLQLPERCYAMDIVNQLMVVATAERHIVVVDMRNPGQIFRTIESPLKYQTRTIACFLDASGFAIGSIEGRVGIQYVDESRTKDNFSFKCHRSDTGAVYSVSDIAIHPVFGTFATASDESTFNFWDKDSKQRLKVRSNAGGGVPIVCGRFNRTGNVYAYAISYDWSKGHEYARPGTKNTIAFYPVKEDDVKPRKKNTR
ncbi:RNA export factor gle2 [Sorochytrium milnesiophthora]